MARPRSPTHPLMLLQVKAKHFCAGLVIEDGKVKKSAHILAYMRGWFLSEVEAYCQKKGWQVLRVEDALYPHERPR